MQLLSSHFFKKTLHILLRYSINKNINRAFFHSLLPDFLYEITVLIWPWKVNPSAPPSPTHSSTQYAHSKSQHFKSLAHIKKSSFNRKTIPVE